MIFSRFNIMNFNVILTGTYFSCNLYNIIDSNYLYYYCRLFERGNVDVVLHPCFENRTKAILILIGNNLAKFARMIEAKKNLPTEGDWEWGGCGDNVNFGFKKSRDFMDAPYKKRSDIKTLMKLHNNDAGRLVSYLSHYWSLSITRVSRY